MDLRKPLLLAFVSAGVLFAESARADGIVFVEGAARVGYATNPGWAANPFGFGVGGRAGVSAFGFYGGVSAMYYLGDSAGVTGYHTLLLGVEGGYTLKLGLFRLRPLVGFGAGSFSEQAPDGVNNPPVTTTVGNVYVEPGALGMVAIGPVLLGIDANALILPAFTLAALPPATSSAKTYASFTAHAQVGFVF
jgi:hypothetical protein